MGKIIRFVLGAVGLGASAREETDTEVSPTKNDSWWNRLIDGYNRLPRPVMVTMIVAMFLWSVDWSEGDFAKWAKAVSTLGGDFWAIVALVLTSFLSQKIPSDFSIGKSKTQKTPEDEDAADAPPIAEGDNPALDKWKKAKGKKEKPE